MVFVIGIRHPLSDAATHVVKTKRIRHEAPNLERLMRVIWFTAALTICHARSDLIAPPEFRLRVAARGIFPFGFAWKTAVELDPGQLLGQIRSRRSASDAPQMSMAGGSSIVKWSPR